MEESQVADVSGAGNGDVPTSEPSLTAPPSTSALSDAPMTDTRDPTDDSQASASKSNPDDGTTPSTFQSPQFSEQTESILKRINANAANAAAVGTPGWEAAKEQIMKDMATSDKFPTPTPPLDTSAPKRGGRGGKRTSFVADGEQIEVKTPGSQPTPGSTGRGRGRGGRPRGRGRGAGRGGKRKREDRSDGESDDSEVYSPVVTMTKSGRSVQKPTSFAPPPESPTTTGPKRKRPYRRNPESAVCKVCLRGTSPASNMIVFCDGCNTPYHQYCHHPPIDKAVVEEVDKEWYCKPCEKERVVPVPEADVADFISAEGASLEQRQRYFASLAPGMLVTLLTRATTLKPDLPVFAPDFQARAGSTTTTAPQTSPTTNGNQAPQPLPRAQNPPTVTPQPTAGVPNPIHPADTVPEGHPPNYPRPGQGLMSTLPPEQDDLQWLVDDGDRFGVFSHMYQVDPRAAGNGLNGVQ